MFWKHQVCADGVMSAGLFCPTNIHIVVGGVTSSYSLLWITCQVWPVRFGKSETEITSFGGFV